MQADYLTQKLVPSTPHVVARSNPGAFGQAAHLSDEERLLQSYACPIVVVAVGLSSGGGAEGSSGGGRTSQAGGRSGVAAVTRPVLTGHQTLVIATVRPIARWNRVRRSHMKRLLGTGDGDGQQKAFLGISR
jgi:hypothetical protein